MAEEKNTDPTKNLNRDPGKISRDLPLSPPSDETKEHSSETPSLVKFAPEQKAQVSQQKTKDPKLSMSEQQYNRLMQKVRPLLATNRRRYLVKMTLAVVLGLSSSILLGYVLSTLL